MGFTAEEVAGFTDAQQTALAWITGFGLAVAEDSVAALVAPKVEADLRSIALQRVAMEIAVNNAGVDEQALRAAYAERPQHELVVRHLVVLSERWRPPEHRDSARARAAEALERIRSGADFEDVVSEYSDEPRAAERGGRLQPGREGSWVPEFWDAASSLDEGAVSGVVETEFGFHVIRLDERRRVPFEDARDDVVETFVDLPEALGHASEWVSGIQAAMAVDTAAIRRWADGDTLAAPLIRWPDTLAIPPYRAADLENYVRRFRSESVGAVRAMDPAELLSLVEGSTRTHALLARAAKEGIEPSASQRAAIRDRWEGQVARWAAALGFESGMSRREVKAAALQGLTAQAQSAAQARSELARLANRIEELYPVSRVSPEGAPSP